ncbi:MAG: LON peptidase substrate-binding domain-containing protein [Planctomycetota bacterium]
MLESLPLLPTRNQVLLPGGRLELDVSRPRSVSLVRSLPVERQPAVVVCPQRDPAADEPADGASLYPVGVLARVVNREERAPGRFALTVEGGPRVRLVEVDASGAHPRARVHLAQEMPLSRAALAAELNGLVTEALPTPPPQVAEALASGEPGRVADAVGMHVPASTEARAGLLAAAHLDERLDVAQRIVAAHRDWQQSLGALDLPTGDRMRQPWPLAADVEARVTRDLANGTLQPDEAADLRFFAAEGYVVWEGLLAPEDVDALVADVRRIGEHPGCFLTTDHRNGRGFRYSGGDFDTFESIFDTYVNFESARRLSFHPKVLRFLELLFDAPPVAFQQLLFQRSNGHPLHQDTAYVCVQEPLMLAATWIALEDVVAGRGELTYYARSHRIPHQFFKDGSKRFNPEFDDEAARRQNLVDQCLAAGCEKRDFIAKKGDVFVWSADLVHGSNPRTLPEAETRLSCVTHYCPKTSSPLWFYLYPEHQGLQAYGDRAWIASSHYRLPTEGDGMARPSFRLPLPS